MGKYTNKSLKLMDMVSDSGLNVTHSLSVIYNIQKKKKKKKKKKISKRQFLVKLFGMLESQLRNITNFLISKYDNLPMQ